MLENKEIFKNIWVIEKWQNTDYFKPDIIPEIQMNERLRKLDDNNLNFYKNWQFNQDTFVKLIQSKNKV